VVFQGINYILVHSWHIIAMFEARAIQKF